LQRIDTRQRLRELRDGVEGEDLLGPYPAGLRVLPVDPHLLRFLEQERVD
jgi:hypothetical protein